MVNVFLTAENPNYKIASVRQNNARMYQLLHDLKRSGAKNLHTAQFIDNKSGYFEHSYHADLPLDEALRLARIYGQESILVEGLGIVNAKTKQVNPITGKHTGQSALARAAYSVVFDHKPKFVAFDIDFNTKRRLNR